MTEQPERDQRGADKLTDHFANERTYLAWLRTGIATVGLGFVVAKFGLVIREMSGVSAFPEAAYQLSGLIGILLTAAGGVMILWSYTRFKENQRRIRAGIYEPAGGGEFALTATILVIALLLVAYLLLTF